jgi:site-specific DNA-methyltransferase (adenine-specific)
MKYKTIYSDPPWRFGSRGIRSGKFQYLEYPTMTIKELCELPIINIIDNEAVLFMWSTSAHLMNVEQIMNAWGFKYVRIDSVWDKVTKNGKRSFTVGCYGLNDIEILLMGTRGSILHEQKVNNLPQHVTAVRPGKHSGKPEIFRQRIEARFPNMKPRLELFARGVAKPEWDVFGQEAVNGIILNN